MPLKRIILCFYKLYFRSSSSDFFHSKTSLYKQSKIQMIEAHSFVIDQLKVSFLFYEKVPVSYNSEKSLAIRTFAGELVASLFRISENKVSSPSSNEECLPLNSRQYYRLLQHHRRQAGRVFRFWNFLLVYRVSAINITIYALLWRVKKIWTSLTQYHPKLRDGFPQVDSKMCNIRSHAEVASEDNWRR